MQAQNVFNGTLQDFELRGEAAKPSARAKPELPPNRWTHKREAVAKSPRHNARNTCK
jgi:hypothetical protein